jgi:hypothetical protein
MVVESDGTEHPGDVEFGQRSICSDLDPNDGDGKAFLNLEITCGNRLYILTLHYSQSLKY